MTEFDLKLSWLMMRWVGIALGSLGIFMFWASFYNQFAAITAIAFLAGATALGMAADER